MAAFLDACRFNPALGGTTDWTYSSAVQGYQSPAAANVVNGRLYKYRAESGDLSQWELGEGAYNTATGVLARSTVLFNSLGTAAKVNFTAPPQVCIVALKEDLISVEEPNSFTTTQQDQIRKNTAQFGGGGYSNIVGLVTGANTMTITADAVALFNSSGNVFGATSVSLALNMASPGLNGLDTGSVSASGYNYFVIFNPATNTVACLASLSATAPTMPSGYTYKRRIGWFWYSGGITTFAQRGNSFDYAALRNVVGGAQPTQAAVSLAGFVPPTVAKIRGYMQTNNNNVSVFDNNFNSVFGINAAPANVCVWQWEFVPQNGPLQFVYQSSSSGGSAGIRGWEDNI